MFPSPLLPFILFALASGNTASSDSASVNQDCQSQMCGTNRSCPTCVGKAGPKGEPGEGDVGIIPLIFEIEERYQKAQQEINDLKEQLKEIRCFLGMKNGDIPDSALSAISSHSKFHYPGRARLDAKPEGKYKGGYCPLREDSNRTWVQVDLGQVRSVAGIIIQGRADLHQWVKTFKVKYGDSERNLRSIVANGTEKIFQGNFDQNTRVVGKFPEKINSRFIRIYPIDRRTNGNACFRFELIRGSCYDDY